jgi:hypothetical protein
MTQNSGPTGRSVRASTQESNCYPASFVHADLAPPATLAVADQDRPAPLVEIMLSERERLLDAQPARQSTMIIARSRRP